MDKKEKILLGGYMTEELLDNLDYSPRTNEEVEENRKLSELYEEKNMVNRRLLYLEKKQLEIMGYLQDSGHRKSKEDYKKGSIVFTAIVIILILIYIFYPKALMPCIMGVIIFFVIRSGNSFGKLSDKQEKWVKQLDELKKEHEELEYKKEHLLAKIEDQKNNT